MSLINDPSFKAAMQQNPLAASMQSATWAHLNEHLAFEYRKQISEQMGVALPALGSKLPPEVEEQLSGLVAQAAQKLLGKNQQEEQAKQAQQAAQDPVLQQQQQELQLRQKQADQKAQADAAKLQLEGARLQQKTVIETAKIQSAEKRTAMEVEAENQRHAGTEIAETQRVHSAEHAESTRHLMQQHVDRESSALDHQVALERLAAEERQAQAEALTPAGMPQPSAILRSNPRAGENLPGHSSLCRTVKARTGRDGLTWLVVKLAGLVFTSGLFGFLWF
jgi:hypothetical protein